MYATMEVHYAKQLKEVFVVSIFVFEQSLYYLLVVESNDSTHRDNPKHSTALWVVAILAFHSAKQY